MADNCIVLVVDDHVDGLDVSVDYLRFAGFTVLSATTGADAVWLAHAGRPHIVIMDLSLPGRVNGCEAIRAIKADPITAAAAVIVVTAWPHADAHEQARDAGASVVLVKPVDMDTLLQTINRLVDREASL